MNLPRIIENIFAVKLAYLAVDYKGSKVLEYTQDINSNMSLDLNDRDFHCRLEFYRKESLTDDDAANLQDLIFGFAEDSCISNFSEILNCTDILYSVLKHDSIDTVIYNMIEGLLTHDNFTKAGIFFLNETLMKLKGVIYGHVASEVKIDSFNFRRLSIPLEKRNHFTDIIFFDKTDTINTDILNSEALSSYFNNEVACCGIYSSKGPVGVILAEAENYDSYKMNHLRLYSKICSVALELSKMLKRLEFAIQDINYFRENLYKSDNFAQIGKLAATVAHELKNPLVAIGGFSRRLEKFVSEPKAQNYLQIIYSEVDRLEKIVSDILHYSREIKLNKDFIYIHDIIFEVVQLLDSQMRLSGVELKHYYDYSFKIHADLKRIKQVFLNLLGNSLDAMPDGGIIEVYTYSREKFDVIEIRDSGGGVSEENIEKIFEPFYTTKEKGTGLGLPLCRKIVKSHGGELTLSNSGDGVRILLELPNGGS